MAVISLTVTEARMKMTKLQRGGRHLNFSTEPNKVLYEKNKKGRKEEWEGREGGREEGEEEGEKKSLLETSTLPLNKATV